jgi:uridylate kinase
VLRALELVCDVMLKATMVDGVYDKDPLKHPEAVKFDKITYAEVLERKLGIMDLTAIALAEKNNLPIVVFNLSRKGILKRIAKGDLKHATLISK